VTAPAALPPTSKGLRRVEVAVRYLILTGALVGVVGVVGHWLAWPLIASSVGPTAYMFAAHPESETSRFRNALFGHAIAVGAGLGALVAFSLLHRPSVSATGAPSFRQAAAVAAAVGVTVALLEVVGSHHAPSAATALLISTGLAKPGSPLIGLVVGLAVVIVLGPLIGRVPLARAASAAESRQAQRYRRSAPRATS
jgi:HPP family